MAADAKSGSGASGLFAADEDVGRDLAAVDWAATPLGQPGSWPQSLLTAVDILLSSRFSMWMAWGQELTFFCNAAYRRGTLGRKYPWALGRSASEVWAEIWDDIGPRIEAVLAMGTATWDEALLLFLERSGYPEETYHTFSYSPLRDDAGAVVGMLCVVSEDTDRVIGERRMATLRDLGSDPSVVRTEQEALGFAGRQLDRNRQDLPFTLTYLFGDDGATARLAGSTGIAAGHPAAPAVMTADDPDPVWPVAVLRRGESVLADLAGARSARLPAGAWNEPPVKALAVPLARQGGAPYGFLVAGLNRYRPVDDGYRAFVGLVAGHLAAGIASARSYQHQQRRAEELAELDRAKTAFFSNISHEFRTPLTLIMGPVQDLQRRLAGADEQVREELEVISRNGLRLGRLVNTLLDFSRIEAGRMQAIYEPVDIALATAELGSVFRSAVDRAGLAFEVDCPPLPEPVYLDRGMWEKVLLNLLSNALKFTFEGSIRVTVRAEDGQAVVTVADTGIGVPEQEMSRLFERFHRIENARSRSNEGSGIGLALVQELVQLHGGTITASSTEGEGTTFTIRLPFGRAHLPAEAIVAAGRTATVSATATPFVQEALRWLPGDGRGTRAGYEEIAPGGGPGSPARAGGPPSARVLVADDNADMREYLARLLRSAGYQVTTVTDGQAALGAVRAAAPDLVISDVMMPRLDGLSLVAALRADPRTAAVPVVLLSARAGQEASIEGLQAGADDYLVKPFSAAELLARARASVELARSRSREAQFRRTLINSLQEGFFLTDEDGTILEANQAFLTLVGYGSDGLPYRWPHPWVPDPDADPGGWAATTQAFASYQRSGGGRYTVPVRHRDGRTVWLACSSASLPGEGGHGLLYVGTARDVTAERLAGQREATLAGFAAALAATREISEMLTTAAREIAAAVHASQVTAALWSSNGSTAVTGWPRRGPGHGTSATVTRALGAARQQPAASIAVLAGDEGTRLLAAPLDGTGSSAIAAEFPAERPVGAEVRELFLVLTSHLAQVLAKARDYEQARTVALTLQHAILAPTELPTGFAARYTPAVPPLEVGGDWYDVISLPGQRTGVVVGDCVGRGLPAAAIMGQLRSASQAVLLRAPGPAEALADLDTFASRIPGAECTSVFCAIIDHAAGTVTYSCAGHPPPILVTEAGKYCLLDQARSLPLAMLPADWQRSQATAALPPGSTLMLYTDGLVERRYQPLDKGIDAAAATMAARAQDRPDDAADHVMSAMTPAAGYEDDVAVLIYRHPPVPLAVQLPADDPSCLALFRTRLRQWMSAAGIGVPDANDIVIAAGEAMANAYEHATAGRPAGAIPVQITLTASTAGTRVRLTVADTGSWRPPPPDRERPAPGTRGHGIIFMHALMDDVRIDPSAHGTTVTLTKELKP
ncbi:MAG TPA: SpoIIE family protein phosphatase [Trebonia sp.]|nr:SpoIIE family protein phosphatase [Trebonia sp.]